MSNVESPNSPLIPCIPKVLSVQYGEKAGSHGFFPHRRYIFTEQGIKRWWAPRLTVTPDAGTGFAAINLGDTAAAHEGIVIPVGRVVLVAHPFETMAARVHIPESGVYFIAARFAPAAPFEGSYTVDVCANGRRIWEGVVSDLQSACLFCTFLRLTSAGFVDLATNAEKDGQTVPCRTFIQYAIVRCDDQTGAPFARYGDGASCFDEFEVLQLHADTPFSPLEIAVPDIANEVRSALFEKEWTLSKEYIESQYQQSSRDLTDLLLNNREDASLKYCIFMVPRSGSTFLSEILARTHKLGFPGESFVPDIVRTFSLGFSDTFSSYEEFLVRRLRSENGVFGIEVESERFQEESQFFSDIKNWRHIYIWREDILSQAISLQISVETGVWHSFSAASHTGKFRYIPRSSIIWQINYLLGVERFFRNYFSENGLSPYRISYETLIADPIGEAKRIAQHIGIECSDADFVGNGKITLQPTAKTHNAYYKLLTVAGGGDIWGYDIVEANGQFIAVLHGVELSLLDISAERSPLLLLAADEEAVREKVTRCVMRQISAMPDIDETSIP
ncbi:Stf0 family sulfotransferase [Paraburkholderia caballeronis]|uniref:Stf0 family sulfotransferase n=1 Tax=Paraburkholderia caballeronis TaxID=416943 RepID=UPI001416FECA|nr:Stf0 family sulfotransferase [Paraburkholderia caballeronis]